jgi:hypothetical protein
MSHKITTSTHAGHGIPQIHAVVEVWWALQRRRLS